MGVGIALLGSDHQAPVDLMNRLHEHLETEEEPGVLGGTFDWLVAYIDYHFAAEEIVVEAGAYPVLDDHREKLPSFTQQIRSICDRYVKRGAVGIGQDLLDFLGTWLTPHTLVRDT